MKRLYPCRKIFAACGALLLPLLLFVASAQARQPPQGQMHYVKSGTGFFVSGTGHVITNHHVVEGCTEVSLQGAVPHSGGKVMAVDKQYDLALIRAEERPRRHATLRHPDATRIRLGEPVLVMGYPLDSFKNAEYKVAEATVTGLRGPTDEAHWIQFSDVVQQGNSGGPLLDSSGNVAGVIVAKTELRRGADAHGRGEVVSRADVAISLRVLMRFLDRHYISYRFQGSHGFLQPTRVEEMARAYVVNVLCLLPEDPANTPKRR